MVLFAVLLGGCKKSEPGSAPVADFVIQNTNGELNEGAFLKVVNTSSASCQKLSYSWDFGNGATSLEKEPSVAYGMHGQYYIKLTVTDEMGRTSIANKEVSVLCIFASPRHSALF